MLKRSLFVLCLSAAAFCLGADKTELDTVLEQKDKLWEYNPPGFIKQCGGGAGFRWTSNRKDGIRYAGNSDSRLTLFGENIYELTAEFKEQRLNKIYISLYNQGDAGNITTGKFKTLLDTTRQSLKKYFQTENVEEDRKRIAGKKFYSAVFNDTNTTAKLRWSFGENEGPEFLNLLIYPKSEDESGTKVSADKKSLPDNVEKDADGSMYIPVPMVDQGEKGYCVVAVLERVLKYYGSDVDQHLLAELAKTSAAGGTNLKDLKTAMDSAAIKFGVKFKCFYENRDVVNFAKFKRMLNLYNRIAKKAKRPRLSMDDFCTKKGNATYYDPIRMLHAMDPKLLTQLRKDKYRSEAKSFFKDVEGNIAKGIPLLWSVELGLLKENGLPQTNGGHMRIIVGCTPDKEEIFYSDSWGGGHEKKKMTYDDAWAITTGGFIMTPRYKPR